MLHDHLPATEVQQLEQFVREGVRLEWRLPGRLEALYQEFLRAQAATARLTLALLPCLVCLSSPLWAARFFDAPDRLGITFEAIEFFVIVPMFAALAWLQWRRPHSELAEWMLLLAFLTLSVLVEAMRHYGSAFGWRLEPLLTVTMPISVIALARIRLLRTLGFTATYLLLIVIGESLYGNPLYDRNASSWLAELLLLGIMLIAFVHAQLAHRQTWAYSVIFRAQAGTDALTGLLNRRALYLHHERLLEDPYHRASAISLIAVDLDHFKRINDRYGHAHGDSVLTSIAHRLQQFAQGPQDAVARLGGDEFVVLLSHCDSESALQIGEHIVDSIRGLAIENRDSPLAIVTLSAGVATSTGGSLFELFRLADAALYRAKFSGRNRLCSGSELPSPPLQCNPISA